MKAVRVFYSQSAVKSEVNRILSIYHLFVTNRFNFLKENNFDDEICHRIIKDLEILCLRHVEDEISPVITMSSVPNLDSGGNPREKQKDLSHPSTPIVTSSTPDNMSFKILSDILKFHGRKHAKEIFNTVSSVLTRRMRIRIYQQNHYIRLSKSCLLQSLDLNLLIEMNI